MGQKPLPAAVVKAKAARNINDAQRGRRQAAQLAGFRASARDVLSPTETEDDGFGAVLASVAAEVMQAAGMERAGIMGSYAAQVRFARQHYRKDQLASVLQALKRKRQAELAALERRTAAELKGRRLAIRRQQRRLKL